MTLCMDTLMMATISCGAIATKAFPATLGELPTLRVTGDTLGYAQVAIVKDGKAYQFTTHINKKDDFWVLCDAAGVYEVARNDVSKAMNAVMKAFH